VGAGEGTRSECFRKNLTEKVISRKKNFEKLQRKSRGNSTSQNRLQEKGER